tara:strand:- start:1945 stop:5349 length:3405 start_codon:yes stop_codon:yes gene_type:complete
MDGELSSSKLSTDEKPQPISSEKNIFGNTKMTSAKKREMFLNAGKSLTVEVELALKDGLTRRGTSTWFENETMRNNLSIRVFLCLNKKLGRRIQSGQVRRKEIERMITQGEVIEQNIDLFDQSNKTLREFRTENIDGRLAYSIPYSAAFTVDQRNPKYLALFAMTVLETGRIDAEYSKFTSRSRPEVQGNTTAEILIQNGSIKRTASIMKTPDGKIWAGPMHYHEGTYMVGAFHSSKSHAILKEEKVPNIVVSDYRLLEDAEVAELQLFPDKPEQRQTKRKSGKRDKTAGGNKTLNKESFLSQAYHSRSPLNEINFVFHLDIDKLIRFQGQYGNLLDVVDEKAKANILSKSKIRNLRIHRHRVKKGIREGEAIAAPFEQRTELIAMSSEQRAGSLPKSVRRSHPDATTTEADPKLIGAIKEVSILDRAQIRSFAVTDFDMTRKTDGLYQYSVELDIEDGTASFAMDQFDKLKKARISLRKFYNESIQHGNFDPTQNRATRSFEDKMIKDYPIPAQSSILSGRRSDRVAVVEGSISSAPWVRTPAVYADVLFNLTTMAGDKASAIAALLYEMSNPRNGNPTGTLEVLRLVESLEGKIKNKLGEKHRSMDELNHSVLGAPIGSKVQGGKSFRSAIELTHRFKKIFDSDILKGVGYDFLSGERSGNIGVRHLSIEQFGSRMVSENNRHFTGATGESTPGYERLKLSYLAPAAVITGGGMEFDLLAETFSRKLHHTALSAILSLKPDATGKGKSKLNPNVSFASAFEDGNENDISREEVISNIMDSVTLAKMGVSIIDVGEYDKLASFTTTATNEDSTSSLLVSSLKIFGETINITLDPIEVADVAAEELETSDFTQREDLSPVASALLAQLSSANDNLFSRSVKIKSIDEFNSSSPRSAVNKEARKRPGLSRTNMISALPNQIKSLYSQGSSSTNRNWLSLKDSTGIDVFADPRSLAMVYFNYQMLNRIEVFVGYKRSKVTGERLLNSPRFSLMTREIIQQATRTGNTLLCRMMPYDNSMLGFSHKERLSLPVFDRHFTLSPRNGTNIDDRETISESNLFVNRLAESGDLNSQGVAALQTTIRASILEDTAASDYITTAIVQQPDGPTKFGTRFGASRTKTKSTTGSSVSEVLKTLR